MAVIVSDIGDMPVLKVSRAPAEHRSLLHGGHLKVFGTQKAHKHKQFIGISLHNHPKQD